MKLLCNCLIIIGIFTTSVGLSGSIYSIIGSQRAEQAYEKNTKKENISPKTLKLQRLLVRAGYIIRNLCIGLFAVGLINTAWLIWLKKSKRLTDGDSNCLE